MTDYKAIKGKTIRSVGSDLGAEGEGEIWFNTASGDYKTIVKVAATWASGGNLNTARYASTAWGTVTAGLTAGGIPGPIVNSEEYDGSTWTEGDNLNTGRSRVGGSMGVQTAAVMVGGNPLQTVVEEYNGTSWSEETDIPTATERGANLGTSTAGLFFGGQVSSSPPPGNAAAETYEYDGTNWTDGGDLGTAAYNMYSFGTQTAGIGAGGYAGSPTGNFSESFDYDGTSWTDASADLNSTATWDGGSAGTVNTAGLAIGGDYPPSANVEAYDGTVWATSVALPAARTASGAAGTGTAAFVTGGRAPGTVNTTFEWAFSSTATPPGAQNIKIITD